MSENKQPNAQRWGEQLERLILEIDRQDPRGFAALLREVDDLKSRMDAVEAVMRSVPQIVDGRTSQIDVRRSNK